MKVPNTSEGKDLSVGETVEINPQITKGNVPQMSATLQGNNVNFTVSGQFGKGAIDFQNESSSYMKGFGIAALGKKQEDAKLKSFSQSFFNESGLSEQDKLPINPGKAYGTHLFRRQNGEAKLKEASMKAMTKGSKVFTDHMEAMKVALQNMGIASDYNPGGMPIDIQDAKKIWFGDSEVDPIEETTWKSHITQGNKGVDPKKVRKFSNPDGSLTWEILNDDKTVMSRFTMGEYAGQKLFAQGGTNAFSEILKKAKEKIGPDIAGQFDSIRTMFGG